MKKALFALALGTFALGIAEFVMMGILGNLSTDLGITVSKAGGLITAYATGVCAGAPCLLFARKLPLKRIMLILAALIAIGNSLMMIAPNYGLMWVARFISGLPHGAYFGVGAIVARRLSVPGKEAASVSFFIAGMTIATLVGVPLATFITDTFSWRVAFGVVAMSGLCALASIRFWVPQVKGLEDVGFLGQFNFLKTLPPWLIFGGVLFGQIGLYCWYSYIDPQMVHVSGFKVSDMSWIMVLAGLGMFIGNIVCGQLATHYKPSIVASAVQALGMVVLLLIYFFAYIPFVAILLMIAGTAILFGPGSPLQSSIVVYSRGGEMLGAALIQIAYNAGNAIAAHIGGTVIAKGYGYTAPALVGIPLVLIGCVLLYILYRRYEHVKNRLS